MNDSLWRTLTAARLLYPAVAEAALQTLSAEAQRDLRHYFFKASEEDRLSDVLFSQRLSEFLESIKARLSVEQSQKLTDLSAAEPRTSATQIWLPSDMTYVDYFGANVEYPDFVKERRGMFSADTPHVILDTSVFTASRRPTDTLVFNVSSDITPRELADFLDAIETLHQLSGAGSPVIKCISMGERPAELEAHKWAL